MDDFRTGQAKAHHSMAKNRSLIMTARNSAEQRETIPPIVSPVKENYLKIERETVFLYFLFRAVGKGDQTHVAGKINVKTH